MIAPVLVKTGIGIGAAGELAVIALAQTTTVDRTAVILGGFGFAGLLVTSVLTLILQRTAANDAREAREEQRLAALELRQSAALQVTKVEEIHTLVNSKATESSDKIIALEAKIEKMHKAALVKAEAAPAVVQPADPNEGE